MGESSGKDIVGILRGYGIVVTPHRYRILKYIMELENFGEDCVGDYSDCYRSSSIYSRLLEDGYFISLSSVYKILYLFRNVGLLVTDERCL